MHAGEPNGVNEETSRPLGRPGDGEAPTARIERLAEIEYVTAAVLGHLDLDTLLEELLARTCRIMNVDTAAILLLDAETNELVPRAARGLEEAVDRGVRIPVGHGFAGRIAAEKRAIAIEDVDHAEILNPLLRAKGVRSLLGAPLLVQDNVRGVLHVGTLTRREFNKADADLLRLVAGRATFVIEHSRLYEQEHQARAEAEAAQGRLSFLAEASGILASSLEYERTLETVARLAVPRIGDWCTVQIVNSGGELEELAVAHEDPVKVELVRELMHRFPSRPDAPSGFQKVLRTGEPEFIPEIPDSLLVAVATNEEHLALLRHLGLTAVIIVPLIARGRVLGGLALALSDPSRRFDNRDLELVVELGRRAAVAIDNARLYRETEERAQAARVLAAVGEGVFLVDSLGLIRLWNEAAEVTTGLAEEDVLGRPAAEAIPGWSALAERIPLANAPGASAVRAEIVPLDLPARELWISISGVGFAEGTVYAFRDMTEERGLERLKDEFVSTVSHELRTPLAAIYGAALTLDRTELDLDDEQRSSLLKVITSEADRLARTVNDILWASRIDSGTMHMSIETCDAGALVRAVIDAARTHLPPHIELEVEVPVDLPPVAADPDKVRQVLANLVENAIKYSPAGGRVDLRLVGASDRVEFEVRDQGLGIPSADRDRIFDKFYRVDPALTHGVSGTGLGLYICRELVLRMGGEIWVEPNEPNGSVFAFELPAAVGAAAHGRPSRAAR